MIGDLFETGGNPAANITGSGKNFTPNSNKAKKRYLADDMDLPPIKRNQGEFSGLVNQGGTCYLNALFQVLHFCPEFRHILLSINLDENTAYEKGSQKYNMIKEFQAFFLRLKCLSFKNHYTSSLTKCFGWDSGDGAEQQDFAEAMRVIVDTLQRGLFEAGLSDKFKTTFTGTTQNYITCMDCQHSSERNEEFYDLILPIKNFEGAKFSSIDESLNFLLNPEIMDGPNQYQCELCNGKRDALKGLKFGKLPEVLTLSLMRFDFNYQTFERMKINDYYKFDLRLDMSKYTGNTDEVYDLCAVIVHRGDPYAGHYHAIVRDTMLEEYDPIGLADKNDKEMQADSILNVPLHREWLPHTREASSEAQEKLKHLFGLDVGFTRYGEVADGKPDKKGKDKGKKDKKGKKDEKKDVIIPEDDGCDDPFPTSVPRTAENEYLFNNWWDFDDTRVSKFNINKLSKFFGGKGKENAYILIYRKTSLNATNQALKLQEYPPSVFSEIRSEEKGLQMLTDNYENMKQVLNIKVRHVDEAYDFQNDQILPGFNKVIQLHNNETMKVARQKVRHEFGLPDDSRFFLIHYESLPNGTIQMPSMIPDVITWEESFFTVKNLYIYHDTDYLLVPIDHPKFTHFASKISLANTKSRIKLRCLGEVHELWVPRYANNQQLVDYLQNFADWDLKAWDIFILDFGEKRALNTIPALQRSVGIPDDLDIILEKTEDIFEKSKRKLVPASDFVSTGEEVRESIFISRDEGDEEQVKFMVDPTITLESLLILLKDYYGIDQSSARRLRDLYTKKLCTKDELKMTLAQIRKIEVEGSCDQGERLRFERGPVPKAGGLCCTIKVDIYDEKGEKIKLKDEFLFTINDTIGDIFEQGCSKMNVDPKDYTLYTCNWNDEPIRKLKDNSSTAEHEGITEDCVLKLLHYSQGMSDEIRTYEVFYSATGFPLDLKPVGKISINENRKLEELKEEIKGLCTKENGFETPFVCEF